MSASIRLSLFGKKGQPVYRIVVMETRSKRNGKYADIIGFYNPNITPPIIKIDNEKLHLWLKRGAIISEGLRRIINSGK